MYCWAQSLPPHSERALRAELRALLSSGARDSMRGADVEGRGLCISLLDTPPPSCVPPTPVSPPRMPAILDGEEAVSKWLDFGEVSAQEALKLIHPTENIAFHPVSSMVNRSWNNAPECLLPLHLLTGKVGAWTPAGPARRSVCSEGPVSTCWDLYNQRLNPNHPQFFLVRSKAAQGRDSQRWLRVGLVHACQC